MHCIMWNLRKIKLGYFTVILQDTKYLLLKSPISNNSNNISEEYMNKTMPRIFP